MEDVAAAEEAAEMARGALVVTADAAGTADAAVLEAMAELEVMVVAASCFRHAVSWILVECWMSLPIIRQKRAWVRPEVRLTHLQPVVRVRRGLMAIPDHTAAKAAEVVMAAREDLARAAEAADMVLPAWSSCAGRLSLPKAEL